MYEPGQKASLWSVVYKVYQHYTFPIGKFLPRNWILEFFFFFASATTILKVENSLISAINLAFSQLAVSYQYSLFMLFSSSILFEVQISIPSLKGLKDHMEKKMQEEF